MQTQPSPNPQPQFPIQELEQIEAAIQASQRWLTTLHGRRDVLTAELEKITRPQVAPVKAAMKTIGPGLEYLGRMTHHWSYIDIHIDLLRRLWTEYPQHREAMAQAIGIYGKYSGLRRADARESFPLPALALGTAVQQAACGWLVRRYQPEPRAHAPYPAGCRACGGANVGTRRKSLLACDAGGSLNYRIQPYSEAVCGQLSFMTE